MASSKTGTSTNDTLGVQSEVFLNFKGHDTSHGFTNCLKHALEDVGIRVFFDDEGIRPGERLSDSLMQAINDSKLYISIFSKRYASSHWCLRELAKIIENSKSNKNGKVMLPIFYDVEPHDVKLKTPVTGVGVYDEALSQLAKEKKYSSEEVKTWRQALKEVVGTKGFKLKDYSRNDEDLLKAVVDEVRDRLKTRQRQEPKNLVGMKDCVADIDKLLDIDSDDVRLILIHGMGGIGKTTLANIIFNKLSHHFDKNCSFLGDVRETAEAKEGLVKLQKQLLSDISYFKVDQNIKSTYHGMNRIGETICNKKMLIVLDDVDKGNQIENLIGVNSLYHGTRILVTTRDKSVLNTKEFKYIWKDYEMVALSKQDALQLFSKHAFSDNSPPADYYNLSEGIVRTTGGLPLALEVIGSYLSKKEKEKWEEWLKELNEKPYDDVLSKLRISYDALNSNQKQIFLDIACFFVGENKTNPMYMWHCSKDAIDVLTQRCMIKVLADDRFWMHDLMRDLGRKIAKEENTRLWDTNDIIRSLRSTEIKKIEALCFSASREVTLKQIKRFPHLRILWLRNVICQGDFTDCLSELRWISLCYPYGTIGQVHLGQRLEATNLLHLQNVVVVNLSGLDITEDVFQSLIKGARKLKVLTITYNNLIHRLSTFPEYSVLEKLDISESVLMKIDYSIGKLRWLTDLRIESCELTKLPKEIGELRNLRRLSLRLCINLVELPDSVSKLKLLTELDVSCTEVKRLQDSIGRLPSLSFVNASFTPIKKLPSTMSKFHQLKTLDLGLCDGIQELPELPRSLTTLKLTSSSLLAVPNLSYLTNLVELVLSDGSENKHRSHIIQTCDLWWIEKLSKLSKLHFCFPNVCAPTTELRFLSQLKELTLHGLDLPTFEQLPSTLIVLKLCNTRGKQVHLDGLHPLRKSRENKVNEQPDGQFPNALESSESLLEEPGCNEPQATELSDHRRKAFLFPSSLKKLLICLLSGFPEVQDIQFVSTLESLEEFSVTECSSLKSLGRLSNSKNLKRLVIEKCPSLKFVEGIDELEYLVWLTIRDCRSMERIFDASSSKIPNKCHIGISRSGELPGSGPYIVSWESYKEKILNETKQASDSEIESEDPLLKTNQENKEKRSKRETESAKQGRRKGIKLRKKARVRLLHPII